MEEERRSMATQMFLDSLPKTPQWVLKAINKSGNGALDRTMDGSPSTPGLQKFVSRFSEGASTPTPNAGKSPAARLTFDDESPTKKREAVIQSLVVDGNENANPNI